MAVFGRLRPAAPFIGGANARLSEPLSLIFFREIPLRLLSTPEARRLIAVIAVSGLTLLGACDSGVPASQAQPAAMPPPEVTVLTVQPEPVTLTRELPGRTRPFLVAEVRPQVTGIVHKRLFQEGSQVRAGQPLYQLEDDTYRASLESAAAAVARAQATLESADLNARRIADLARVNAVSKQDHDNAVAALRQAQADLKAAQAAHRNAGITLEHASIQSPISGRIGKSTVTVGALVTANQAMALATVQQFAPMYVDVAQSATELLQLRREIEAGKLSATSDIPVTIVLEDGSPYPHKGKLTFADLSVEPGTGSFLLRVEVPNPDEWLLPGMYVRAILSVGERSDGILVPTQSVRRDAKGGASVVVVDADDVVHPRPVQTSRTIGQRTLIDAGLQAGDRVIVEGLQKAQPGGKVRPVEVAAAASTENAAPADASAD